MHTPGFVASLFHGFPRIIEESATLLPVADDIPRSIMVNVKSNISISYVPSLCSLVHYHWPTWG
jgi:hypothetical protein